MKAGHGILYRGCMFLGCYVHELPEAAKVSTRTKLVSAESVPEEASALEGPALRFPHAPEGPLPTALA